MPATARVTCYFFSPGAHAFELHDAESASDSGPSEPSIHVDSMAASLVGGALGKVLVAASGAAQDPEFAGDASRCHGEPVSATHRHASTA